MTYFSVLWAVLGLKTRTVERANPSGKIGGLSKRPNDETVIGMYLAIKEILRTRAEDFADSAKSGQVSFTDMLQNH
jgi:hypothetical protein